MADLKKPKKKYALHKKYEIKGQELKRKNAYCPKCGPGFFLAAHSSRATCGNCRYTEFNKK